jgi:hypothetical protein
MEAIKRCYGVGADAVPDGVSDAGGGRPAVLRAPCAGVRDAAVDVAGNTLGDASAGFRTFGSAGAAEIAGGLAMAGSDAPWSPGSCSAGCDASGITD